MVFALVLVKKTVYCIFSEKEILSATLNKAILVIIWGSTENAVFQRPVVKNEKLFVLTEFVRKSKIYIKRTIF